MMHHLTYPPRILRHLLTMMALLFTLATQAQVKETVRGITYQLLYDYTAQVSASAAGEYTGDIDIPAEIEHKGAIYRVTGVQESAFMASSITSIRLPEGLTKVGKKAFSDCSKLHTAYIPSTVTSLPDYAFYDCGSLTALHLAAVRPSTTSGFTYEGLSAPQKAFSYIKFDKCVVYVPARALDWYKAKLSYFRHFVPVATSPKEVLVTPSFDSSELTDYNDLRQVGIDFIFPDDTYEDVVSLTPSDETAADDYYVTASLILEDGTRITLDSQTEPTAISVARNRLTFNFGDYLEEYNSHFVASIDGPATMAVGLELEGQIAIEDTPFALDGLLGENAAWRLPLLPAVYPLTSLPTVTPKPTEGIEVIDHTDLATVTFIFDDFEWVHADSIAGAYFDAILYQEDKPICTFSLADAEIDGNVITLKLPDLTEQLLVRRSAEIAGFDFSLELSAQVDLSDGRTYRFFYPCEQEEGSVSLHWAIPSLIIPEPTGYSLRPNVGETVTLSELSDVAITFDGVERVEIGSNLSAHLYLNGQAISELDESEVFCNGDTLFLPFPDLSERLISYIGTSPVNYTLSLDFSADLITDGFPYSFALSQNEAEWNVEGIQLPLPECSVILPEIDEETTITLADLATVQIVVNNYRDVDFLPAESGASFTVSLTREGRTMCAAGPAVTTIEGNVISVDFSELITDALIAITPDDSTAMALPDGALPPLELSAAVHGTLLFDGYPATFSITAEDEGAPHWKIEPLVVHTIEAPAVIYAAGRLTFSCGVRDAVYHYTITTPDITDGELEEEAEKRGDDTAGSFLSLPISQALIVNVRATREGYYDSEPTTSFILLEPNEQ